MIGLLRIPSNKTNCSLSSPELQFMLLPFGASSDAGAAYFNHINLKNEVGIDVPKQIIINCYFYFVIFSIGKNIFNLL